MSVERGTKRTALEGLVIVVSILIAFALEAGWESAQEEQRRALLLEDLTIELRANREDLRTSLDSQAERLEQLSILLQEVSPDAVGISTDSVIALQTASFATPTYDPALGVLDLLVASGDLALLENRELRTRLAALPATLADFLGNQALPVDVGFEPDVIFGTQSALWDYSGLIDEPRALTETRGVARENAIRVYTVIFGITAFTLPQGEAILEEFDAIIELLETR